MINVSINDEIKKEITAKKFSSISDVLRNANINIAMPCSGKGTCGKCKIHVENQSKHLISATPTELEIVHILGLCNEITPKELKLLSKEEIASGLRLACCVTAFGDIAITTHNHKKELGQLEIQIDQIETELELEDIILDISYDNYAVVVDVGTTTMVLKLLSKTSIVETASMLNPQKSFGADVVSRIESSLAGKDGELQQQVINAINDMLAEVCKKSNIKEQDIDYAVITGNTAMMLLLLRYSVKSIATAPFIADQLFGKKYTIKEVPIHISPKASIDIPYCISAYVGSDITTAISYCGFFERDKNSLMIDLGTNGEIVFWCQGKLLVASTAAGPAFEGAGIQMGMNGKIGAIDNIYVEKEGKVSYTVIGEVEPIGLCGSGIISAIATLLEAEIIDDTGEMVYNNENYFSYKTEFDENPAFIIDGIMITQKDIRMVQLAKSAICAGVKTLVETAGINLVDVEELYIAGGFGRHINIADAVKIGLIPEELQEKSKVMGNAALGGAVNLAFNQNLSNSLSRIALGAEVVELAGSKVFSDYYIDGMMFE